MILALSLGLFVFQNVTAKTKKKSLPKIITKNHCGFLSAGSGDTKYIKNYGASNKFAKKWYKRITKL
ncbi:MAG: hypothetical protein COS72_02030 [Candidatus Moranbacteria bacterium CG06_land_8_20_14_3_00_43_56]|nr:MAG: hypothetical protein COS72_02030 [Candidatus Moranbacteria bacterium CG06_land_8_20_14_3_00_43_56]PIV83736.1 MAG: hypothetical protein COW51_03295 [Candidatus Moranbacteria bacterium CG17_big_fil_post_rev_8_21_14_2_50_44_12]PIW93487.1 MAG: hypothetical protein COZ87_01125 [Candidatus Moranbacteria bacterium CG_4_8_14_3_um_filter_43_15]PJA85425.1 MAG: hypothetical protein CO142_03945 [Candidatus Moranbacteria bacterium CG_4_9_14_3_um_filter_44_28]